MGVGPVEVVVAERKLLELAPGSRWNGDCVIDRHGDSCYAYESPGGHAVECHESAYAQDIIALLHRAGLLDGLLAEAWDNGYGSGKMDTNDDAKRGGKHETENPHRKAGANG